MVVPVTSASLRRKGEVVSADPPDLSVPAADLPGGLSGKDAEEGEETVTLAASNPTPIHPTPTPTNPTSAPAPLRSSTLFDGTAQDILKGQVDFEVKRVLDLLKKERPELLGQADLMNLLAQKTRKWEENLQQFHVREQRLRDTVDQLCVTIKAVQSNVDQVKNESGGTVLTEESMRAWVPFFFNEQMSLVKAEWREDFVKIENKVVAAVTALNALESKMQNTLQNLVEASSFVYGVMLQDSGLYEKPDSQSKEVSRVLSGQWLMLAYPIVSVGNDRWMKVRTVHQDTAQLGEAWVPVLYEGTPYVGQFTLVL
ncbi:MAG: hypothetical protein EBY17_30800 [Acidobacteriia bacterium]|nr:hypothetical protein [Terriglobia bacterium]